MTLTAIRPATHDDIGFLVELVNSAYQPIGHTCGWTDEARYVEGTRTSGQSLAELLGKPDALLLLGLHDDAAIATVHLEKKSGHVHLGMLAVHPAWQSQGIGGRMLAYAEQYASAHFQATKLAIIVISLRTDVLRFYQRRGYRPTGVTIPYARLCTNTCKAKIDGLEFAELVKTLP